MAKTFDVLVLIPVINGDAKWLIYGVFHAIIAMISSSELHVPSDAVIEFQVK